MKSIKKALALFLSLMVLCCLPLAASAEEPDTSVIDPSQTATLNIYKYDLTKATADGVWDSSSYVSSGVYDEAVNEIFGSDYAIEGVEFTYLKVADIADEYYEFAKSDATTALLTALGLDADDAAESTASVLSFTSDTLSAALSTALNANATTVKNSIEAYVKANGGTAMSLTDQYGNTEASQLPLGLYLLVETKVPENVTTTCNPFFVSLPMTSVDGSEWNYDVTVYPKNLTGLPTLDKTVTADGNYAHTATASGGDNVSYRIESTLPTITSTATGLTEYSFLDQLPKGLAYTKNDVLIQFYEDAACSKLITSWDGNSGKFSVEYTDMSNATAMTITMTENGLSEINSSTEVYDNTNALSGYSDCTMRIIYTAKVNSDSSFVCGDAGNTNTVKLTWKRSNADKSDFLMSDAHVYSYGIDLTKQFSDGLGNFSKVKFILRNETDGKYLTAALKDGVYYVTGTTDNKSGATSLVADSTGHIIVKSMEADSYKAIEVETDKGYTLLKRGIAIDIINGAGAECATCHDEKLAVSAKVNNASANMSENNELVKMTVVNTKGFELPQTGSYGTWMFTVGGIVLIGVALYFMSKLLNRQKG